MNDPWVGYLSDYLDDELPESIRELLESHLKECDECSAVLAELRQVITRARALTDIQPPRDLWSGIAAQIQNEANGGTTELEHSPRRALPRSARRAAGLPWYQGRRVSLSLPQLAAACVLLMLFSGAVGWLFRPPPSLDGNGASPDQTVAQGELSAPAASHDVPRARPVEDMQPNAYGTTVAAVRWEEAVRDQEQIFKQMRAQLDTTTVAVLDKNLMLLDQSIEEIRDAQEDDPDNAFYNNRLADSMRRKLRLLRWASTISTREI